VLNDNGPELAAAAILRIRSYAGNPAAFATVSELEDYFRTVYKPYGWLSDAQWRRLTETSTRRLPDGRVTPHYDPAMVMQFTHHIDEYLQWDDWERLDIPVLCLRGESSDLLLRDVAERMRTSGPCAVVAEIKDCGHAPALNTPAQWALVERFSRGLSGRFARSAVSSVRPFVRSHHHEETVHGFVYRAFSSRCSRPPPVPRFRPPVRSARPSLPTSR
jgi:pimeloyl-ACP methyl ester carboxylesterase